MLSGSDLVFPAMAAAAAVWLASLPRLGKRHEAWDRVYDAAHEHFKAARLNEARSSMEAAHALSLTLGARSREARLLSAFGLAEICLALRQREPAERYCREAIDLAGRVRSNPLPAADAESLLERILALPPGN